PFDIEVWMNAEGTSPRCVIPAEAGTWNWECSITGLSGGPQSLRLWQNGVETIVSFEIAAAPFVVDFPVDGGIVYGELPPARGSADTGSSISVYIDGPVWCFHGPLEEPGDPWSCSGPPITAPGFYTFEAGFLSTV